LFYWYILDKWVIGWLRCYKLLIKKVPSCQTFHSLSKSLLYSLHNNIAFRFYVPYTFIWFFRLNPCYWSSVLYHWRTFRNRQNYWEEVPFYNVDIPTLSPQSIFLDSFHRRAYCKRDTYGVFWHCWDKYNTGKMRHRRQYLNYQLALI
jgi:hypothetical protein